MPEDPVSQKEDTKLFGDNKRREEFKQWFHRFFIFFLSIGFLLLVAVLVTRMVHLIIPTCYHWLNKEQITALDKLLFSGALGGLIGKHLSVSLYDRTKS